MIQGEATLSPAKRDLRRELALQELVFLSDF